MRKYQIFILKELKQILANKKAFIICFLFLFYTPFLNINATNNVVPFDFIIPILFIIAGCYPSEYSYSIMNSEFENKTYDIIFLSKTNPFIILISKLLFPVFLGIFISFCSIFINDLFAVCLNYDIYSQFLTIELSFFIILSIILSNVITVWLLNFFKKVINKQVYTITIFVNLLIIISLFYLFYNGYIFISLLILIALILILFTHNILLLKIYYYDPTLVSRNKAFLFNNPFLILIQNGYKHTWNLKKTLALLLFTIILSYYILFQINSNSIYLIFKFLPLLIMLFVTNEIIYKSYVIDKNKNIDELYLICKYGKNKILISKILYCVILTTICILIYTLTLYKFFEISEILHYLLLNVLLCISMIGMATFTDIKFNKQIGFLISLINMGLSFVLYTSSIDSLKLILLIIFFYYCSFQLLFKRKRH